MLRRSLRALGPATATASLLGFSMDRRQGRRAGGGEGYSCCERKLEPFSMVSRVLFFQCLKDLWKQKGKRTGLTGTHETKLLQRIIDLVHGHELIVKVIRRLPPSVVAARG